MFLHWRHLSLDWTNRKWPRRGQPSLASLMLWNRNSGLWHCWDHMVRGRWEQVEAVGGCTGLLLGSEPMVFISCDISDEGSHGLVISWRLWKVWLELLKVEINDGCVGQSCSGFQIVCSEKFVILLIKILTDQLVNDIEDNPLKKRWGNCSSYWPF